LVDLKIDERKILNWILRKQKYVDLVHLAQDRNKWPSLLDVVISPGVPQNAGDILTSFGSIVV